MIKETGPIMMAGPAITHCYDQQLMSATNGESPLPWQSPVDAIAYLNNSEKELEVVKQNLHNAQASIEYTKHDNFQHQVELLTSSAAERIKARRELAETQRQIQTAQSKILELAGLRALAAQEKVLFFSGIGQTVLRGGLSVDL